MEKRRDFAGVIKELEMGVVHLIIQVGPMSSQGSIQESSRSVKIRGKGGTQQKPEWHALKMEDGATSQGMQPLEAGKGKGMDLP